MEDTYEKDLGAKSSLTTSDYIRVVGSDNVSYKQGMASVLATMGLSLYYTDTNSTSDGSTDSDRYKMSFQRVLTTFSNSSPTVNRAYPIMVVTSGTSASTFVGVVNVTPTAMRFLVSHGNSNYSGQFVRSSNTINLFESIPTRAEVDALRQIKTKTVTGTTTATGAINMGLTIDSVKVLDIRIKNPTVGYAFHRGDGYATVFTVTNNVMTVLANTSVTIDVFYVEN